MNPDIVRWNEKYHAASDEAFTLPDELLVAHRALLARDARALDVACGAGANAIFAAQLGCRVVGVDASLEGLRIAARRAKAAAVSLSLLNIDLEVYRPPPDRFDLVMVFRYLNRDLLPALKSTLRPGGLLIYKTFNRNFLKEKPEFNPEYVIEPGELRQHFADLEPIDSNDDEDNPQVFSWWVGRKPSG